MNKLLLSAVLFLSFLTTSTAQTEDSSQYFGSTEIVVGLNSTNAMSFGDNQIVDSRSGMGWQIGVLRRHHSSAKVDLLFGMMIAQINHEVLYQEETIAYRDFGIRNYQSYYMKIPVDWEIKQKNKWFTRLGFGLGYIVSNQTFESAKRIQHLTDEGIELVKPTEKLIFQYREIDAFDAYVKVGGGKNFTFGKIKCNASVSYSQGLLKKDTGIRTGIFECSLGFSLH